MDAALIARCRLEGEPHMYYVVKQGDYLAKIAREHGFSDVQKIWSLGENASLKNLRKNPNVLFPGDRVFLPDAQEKKQPAPTTARSTFKRIMPPLSLHIKLIGIDGKPLSGAQCRLNVDDASVSLEADKNGLVKQAIGPTVAQGQLGFEDSSLPFEADIPLKIRIGHLDPVDTPSGQAGRLNNLGYDAGAVDATATDPRAMPLQFRSAVEEFQCDNHLGVDGICGPNTQAKLLEVHGC